MFAVNDVRFPAPSYARLVKSYSVLKVRGPKIGRPYRMITARFAGERERSRQRRLLCRNLIFMRISGESDRLNGDRTSCFKILPCSIQRHRVRSAFEIWIGELNWVILPSTDGTDLVCPRRL